MVDAACATRVSRRSPRFADTDIVQWRESHGALARRCGISVIAPPRDGRPRHCIATFRSASRRRFRTPRRMGRRDPIRVARCHGRWPDDDRPVVAVLGAIGPDKGARRLERMVELTRERGLPLRWVLIGYLDRGREPWQSDDGIFTMHGPYDSRMLRSLLDHYRVQLVAYPSVCLGELPASRCRKLWVADGLRSCLPIGALADRVAATGAGWVLSEDDWRLTNACSSGIAVRYWRRANTWPWKPWLSVHETWRCRPSPCDGRTYDGDSSPIATASRGCCPRAPIAAARCPIAQRGVLRRCITRRGGQVRRPLDSGRSRNRERDDALTGASRAQHCASGTHYLVDSSDNSAPKALINTSRDACHHDRRCGTASGSPAARRTPPGGQPIDAMLACQAVAVNRHAVVAQSHPRRSVIQLAPAQRCNQCGARLFRMQPRHVPVAAGDRRRLLRRGGAYTDADPFLSPGTRGRSQPSRKLAWDSALATVGSGRCAGVAPTSRPLIANGSARVVPWDELARLERRLRRRRRPRSLLLERIEALPGRYCACTDAGALAAVEDARVERGRGERARADRSRRLIVGACR